MNKLIDTSPRTMSPSKRWWVWKFGGSSLADGRRIINCANLVIDQLKRWQNERQQITQSGKASGCEGSGREETGGGFDEMGAVWAENHLCVVVSAMSGVTDLLLEAISRVGLPAENLFLESNIIELFKTCPGALGAKSVIDKIYTKHLRACELLIENSKTPLESELIVFHDLLLEDLQRILNALDFIGPTASQESRDYILGFGELWSRRLFAIALHRVLEDSQNVKVSEIDSHEIIVSFEARDYEANQHLKTSNLHKEPKAPKFTAPSPRLLGQNSNENINHSFLPDFCRSDLTNCENAQPNQAGSPPALGTTYDPPTSYEVTTCGPKPITPIGLSSEATSRGLMVAEPFDDVLYTLESEMNSLEVVPSTPPLDGGNFENWPLPPRVQADYWPTLQPNTSQCPYPGIDFQASYKCLRTYFIKKIAPNLDYTVGEERSYWSSPRVRDNSRGPLTLLWIAQGFVSRSRYDHKRRCTLGRNGSDTSAVAYGVLLRAEGVTIWSDVEGIFSADPHICTDAVLLNSVTYEEALELASFGAKVLHPACLIPAHHIHMPILLKSTLHPQKSGTLITDTSFERVGEFGKTVTSLRNVTLITVQNRSFVPKFLSRLFTAVEEGEAAPLLISQSSTSSAVTIGVNENCEDSVVGQLVRVFKYDVSRGAKIQLNIERDCSLLCVTGRGQSGYPGALAAWCDSLADLRVSIKSVSQSSTELSTCFAVKRAEERKALVALHEKILQKLCTTI